MIEQLARELEGVKAALAEAMRTIASLEARSASLESALVNTAAERDVLARRLYGPKTERQQTSELQLTLGGLLEEQKRLQRELDALRLLPIARTRGDSVKFTGEERALGSRGVASPVKSALKGRGQGLLARRAWCARRVAPWPPRGGGCRPRSR